VPKSDVLLAAELKKLGGLGTDVLRQRWAEFYGMAPSPRISRELLIRAVPNVCRRTHIVALANPASAAGAPGRDPAGGGSLE